MFVDISADDGLRATPFSSRVIKAAFVKGTEPVLPSFWGSTTPWGLKLRDLLKAENQLFPRREKLFKKNERRWTKVCRKITHEKITGQGVGISCPRNLLMP
ncbi:hypothetical protein [Desulfofundulus sp.]|uniref:hypothetical protein n=1 Tax=Desulfofundulus sp. TaxID=2282750 RepID=UPI003C72F815